MSATEKVRDYIKEKLGEDVFTPDFIEGLVSLDLDSETAGGFSQDDVDKAVSDAVAENDKGWNNHFLTEFFANKTEKTSGEQTPKNQEKPEEEAPDRDDDGLVADPYNIDISDILVIQE